MAANEKFTGYFGTYTKGDSEGIYSFTLDAANGKIVEVGTPDEVRSSENPIVRQFIEGRAEGPITEESEEFVKFDTKPAEPIDRRK